MKPSGVFEHGLQEHWTAKSAASLENLFAEYVPLTSLCGTNKDRTSEDFHESDGHLPQRSENMYGTSESETSLSKFA